MPNSWNPFELIARRWTPSARVVRLTALITVVMAVVIVVTGGAVRLTQSGLGCETWPKCTDNSLTPTSDMGIHGVIEFGNRMLTYVLCGVIGLFIIAARSYKPTRRSLTRLGWVQFWIVMGNAVVGGITVLTGLNPYIVSSHFLISMALLTVAMVTWQRTREGDAAPRGLVATPVRQLSWLLVGAAGVLIVIGAVVTGSGPHAGDATKVHRIPLDWQEITQLHVDFVYIVFGLTVALWFTLRAVAAPKVISRTVVELFAVLLSQGLIGYIQYFTHLPEFVVGMHMLGSCLVWIAVLRVFLALRERGEAPAAVPAPTGEHEALQPAEEDPAPAASR
ncbi:COX15/CtaA family protein [Streptomyces zagrosensis]|uniref:Cytochrome c oxidase assembly protein subunit 15 n=1 Tax=Streptomyces zagrosensis TaxID=1042984 RepID=A0A7W9Q4U1_9ACTN|nr:COX15/CtaA family protein [Streptomyces zagrosensis]MBB5933626.1 cytochrome c oxidase assembly protein subunit 15 [Streptomyces zagrosensis]